MHISLVFYIIIAIILYALIGAFFSAVYHLKFQTKTGELHWSDEDIVNIIIPVFWPLYLCYRVMRYIFIGAISPKMFFLRLLKGEFRL